MQTGYPSSPYLLRPFSEPELDGYYGAERRRRYAFNQKLSSIRIYIEHVFGLLKSRFQSLRQLGRHEDIKQAYRVIQALMVIHNLCIDFGDQPMDGGDDTQGNVTQEEDITQEDILGYGGVEMDEAVQLPEGETAELLREEGQAKRNAVLDDLFPVGNYL